MERKYQMTKIKPGDWLLPSNDGQTMFRIHSYTDGPTNGLDIPRDRDFWAVEKMPISRMEQLANGTDPLGYPEDPFDWDHWAYVAGSFYTRADAIEEAERVMEDNA